MGRLNSTDTAVQVAHELEADDEQDAGGGARGASGGRDAFHRLLAERGEPAPGDVADLLGEYPDDTDAIMGSVQELLGNTYASRVAQAGSPGGGKKKKKKKKKEEAAKDETPAIATEAEHTKVLELLRWNPDSAFGDTGFAAWLLAAHDLGFLVFDSGHDDSRKQLVKFAAGEHVVRSKENPPGKNEQQEIEGKVKKVKSGVYDVTVADPQILETLVWVAWGRLYDWSDAGGGAKTPVLTLGTLVRGDPGFGGSDHTDGNATDVHMNMETEDQALDFLSDLPPGTATKIVVDKPNHVHISRDGDTYGFGFPMQGPFFDAKLDIKKQRAKAAQGADTSQTLHVEGYKLFSGYVHESTGTWDGTKWKWTPAKKTGKKAKLKSTAVRDALANLGKEEEPEETASEETASEDGNSDQ